MRETPRLSALNAAQTPRAASLWARVCVWLFLLSPPALLVSPWQQNISGTGRVSAFAPAERQQIVEAPVSGRIVRWLAKEGMKVKAGDILLEITDVDPDFLPRLRQQREASAAKLAAKEEELKAYRLQNESLAATRDMQVATAQHRLDTARQRVRAAQESLAAAQATLEAAARQSERLGRLLGEGLVSRRDFEVAARDGSVAKRGVSSAQAGVDAALAEQRAAAAEVERIRADAQARLDSAMATLKKIQGELEDSRASLLKMDVDLSRQQSQAVTAPRDGTVLRLLVNPQGDLVRQGDGLLALVPDVDIRAVELWVGGNDAALITPGRPARLQFEGWPALQFMGWPEVAVGTFGGTVAIVDAGDDGKGKFRVLVTPSESGPPWPSERFLRQGSRVKGWVLLNRVTMAYELWRQLNAFPPLLPAEAPMLDLAKQKLK
jgi:multidrug efflux pump subunit AcrA (membrane-fusion protein)